MRKTWACLLGIAIFVLMGCSTLPAPKSENDNLVIGMIIHNGEGYQKTSDVSVNGTHKSGIELTIKNINSNEEYIIRTKKNGLFYTGVLPEGTYQIEQFYLKVTAGSAWADTYSSPNDNWTFIIKNGEVNNLGVLNWEGKMRGGTNFNFSRQYNVVEDEFKSQFPKTEWLIRPMLNTSIYKR